MSDAKPLTTAEVEGMPHRTERARPFALECSMHVLVRRDELLATTRALETAQVALVMRSQRTVEEIERAEKAEAERDAARRELAELALEVGYGERPEGQGHIIHADGKTLAGAWLLERKGRDQAEADRDIARATVAELLTALAGLERRFLDPTPTDTGGSCWCDPRRYLELSGHEDECVQARAALAKAKESAND